MGRLFKAFIFKARRDVTFRITLIVGAGIAVFMTVLYLVLEHVMKDQLEGAKLLTGPNMLINSLSPVQNFGIAIPVNLISFTCLEFSQGTIRNKIIAGNSKFKIYASLCLSGLIFALALLIVYAGLCTALGSIFGGFNLDEPVAFTNGVAAPLSGTFILQLLVVTLFSYVSIVSFAIFTSTAFRSIGPCIPIVMITLMFAYLGVTIVSSIGQRMDVSSLETVLKVIDPLYAISGGAECKYITDVVDGETIKIPTSKIFMATDTFALGIVSNVVYAAIFFVAGSLLFKKRDVK